MRSRSVLAVALGLGLIAAACSDDVASTTVGPSATQAPATTPSATTVPPTTATPATTAAAEPITFLGADDVESVISDTSRIVALNGDITEILFEIGAGSSVVGVDVTTTFPPEAAALAQVGFGQRLAAEPVIALDPTLVIGDKLVGPPEVLDQIRATGVPVVIIEWANTIDEIRPKIETVSMLVGRDDAGAELAEAVDAEIAAATDLASQAAETPKVVFLYARGPEALLLFGPGSPPSSLISAAGGFDPVVGPPFNTLTPEGLLEANPDIIITTLDAMNSLGGLAEFEALPGVAETTAGQSGQIIAFDEALFLALGPRSGEALMQLIVGLHPELAPEY